MGERRRRSRHGGAAQECTRLGVVNREPQAFPSPGQERRRGFDDSTPHGACLCWQGPKQASQVLPSRSQESLLETAKASVVSYSHSGSGQSSLCSSTGALICFMILYVDDSFCLRVP